MNSGAGGKGLTVQIFSKLFWRAHFTALMTPVSLLLSPVVAWTRQESQIPKAGDVTCSRRAAPAHTVGAHGTSQQGTPKATEGQSLEPGLRGADIAPENKNIQREKTKPTLKGDLEP